MVQQDFSLGDNIFVKQKTKKKFSFLPYYYNEPPQIKIKKMPCLFHGKKINHFAKQNP
jgi:hypothetical protein